MTTITTKLINNFPKRKKLIAKFIATQESDNALAETRMTQDMAVNYLPKLPFVRSHADFFEVSITEFGENIAAYFGPTILGEKIFKPAYTSKLSNALKKNISKPAAEILKDVKAKKLNFEDKDLNNLITKKAAIAMSALLMPLSIYALGFAKNLFTLKLFKQADFKNIANLDKNDKTEDKAKQEKVRKNSIQHIKLAGILGAGCIAFSTLLATRGKNSKILQKFSEAILDPGNKIYKPKSNSPEDVAKATKKANAINKYFSIDFSDNKGKLSLSRGQLTACITTAGVGYLLAAKDRGKQNFLEVLFRFPLVGFYVVTGSEIFQKGFVKALSKKESYASIIGKDLKIPKLSDLGDIAEKMAKKNGTTSEVEFKKLFSQKANIVVTPFLFSMTVMGLFVAGVSKYFTQYRYDKEKEAQSNKLGSLTHR